MATLKDVARRAEVSISTVTAILNDRPHCYASVATRERVRQAAEEIGYRPNRLAQALVRGASGLIGVLTPDAETQTAARALKGIEEEAMAAGYGLLLRHTHALPEREQQHLQFFRDSAVEGIISISQEMVRIDNLRILMENHNAAQESTEVILQKGHLRIVFLDDPQAASQERRAGYEEAMQAAGRQPTVIELRTTEGSMPRRLSAARAVVNGLLTESNPPTAIIAVTDLEALGALYACQDSGLCVPDDISLAGFDDLEIGRLASVPITTVRFPFYEAGRLAVQRLQNRHKEPLEGTMTLPSILLRRASTGDTHA